MNDKNILCILISLVAGILTGWYSSANVWWALLPFSLSIVFFIYGIYVTKRNIFKINSPNNLFIAVNIFFGIGLFTTCLSKPAQTTFTSGEYCFSGQIEDYTPTTYGDKLLVSLSDLKERDKNGNLKPLPTENLKALITIRDATELSYGDFITGEATFQTSETRTNFYNKEYSRYLRSKGIYLTGYADSSDCRIEPGCFSISSWMKERRDWLETGIEKRHLNVEFKNFLISLLLGDKSYIDSDDRIIYSDAGISHLFAVSGFHVSMMAMFIILLLSLFFKGKNRKWKFIATIPIIWFYILLVGAPPSTCRAGLMITISLSALFLERKNDPLKALAWAIIIILAFSPTSLFDAGFQLSIVCVGSLIFIVEPLNFIDHRSHPLIYRFVSILLVTLIAVFSTWMISAYYFHQFSLAFLPLNILAVPLMPFFTGMVLFYFFLCSLGYESEILQRVMEFLFEGLKDSAEYLSTATTKIAGIYPDTLSVTLWLAGLFILGLILRKRSKLKYVALPLSLLVAAVIFLIASPSGAPQGFIIQKNSSASTIMSYNDGKESLITLPEAASTAVELNNNKLVEVKKEEMSSETIHAIRDADIILISKGCKNIPNNLETHLKPGSIIVTHPSLHWRYEKRIMEEARKRNLRIHSIRYQGPFHFFD